MRLSFNRPIFVLKGIALLAVFALLTGCSTPPSPEPDFQDYDPGAWTPPGQTTNTTPSQPVAEPAPEPVPEPETTAPAGLTDIFRVGDTVNIQVTGVSSEIIPPHEERIKDDGSISLYLIGSVKAAGRTQGDLQRELQREYERFFKNPVVTVNAAPRFYYVGGEVKRPGAQPYLGITTVTKAIQSAGDFTDFGKKSSIRVIRADGTSLKVNFNKAIEEPSLDPPIYPGDKIHVPRRILW